MEKKVLLKDLVDGGTNLRKQIISHVQVSDELQHVIGELWDANTIVKIIVDGASDDYNTLRKAEMHIKDNRAFIEQVKSELTQEISRAHVAEADLQTQITNTNTTLQEFRNTYNDAVNDIDTRVSKNETDITSLKQSIQSLSNRISELESAIDNF